MIRKTAQLAVLLLTVLFSVSCGIFRGSGKLVLTEKDSGRILEAEVGDTGAPALRESVDRIFLELRTARHGRSAHDGGTL